VYLRKNLPPVDMKTHIPSSSKAEQIFPTCGAISFRESKNIKE
jgi:hypothetical protein